MRKRTCLVFLLAVFMGLTSFCAKKAPPFNKEDAVALIQNISQSPLEVEVNAEESGIKVGPGEEKSQYRITLMNPKVSFSTAVYKKMNIEFPEFDIPIEMGKMVMIYAPSEKSLQLKSVEKIAWNLKLPELLAFLKPQEMKKEQEVPDVRFRNQMEKVDLEGYDLSPLIDSEEKTFEDVLSELVSSNKKMKAKVDGFAVNFKEPGEDRKTMNFSIKSMESSFQAESDLVTAFLQKQSPGDALSVLLEKKAPLIDLETLFRGIDFEYISSEKKIKAGMESAGFSYSLEPNQKGDYFDFMSGWDVTGVYTEGMPDQIEVFARLNEANFKFSLENLSSEFIMAYFDLVREAQAVKMTGKAQARQEEMIMKSTDLGRKFMESKPIIKVSISPLDHYFGKIQAQGEFQFIRMGPPVGKAEAKVLDMDQMEQNITQTLPPDRAQAVIHWIKQMFQVDDTGQGKMTFEIIEDDPSHFYLNGEKHAFNQ